MTTKVIFVIENSLHIEDDVLSFPGVQEAWKSDLKKFSSFELPVQGLEKY